MNLPILRLFIIFIALFCTPAFAKKSALVIIDPGHGGKDPGTVWGNVKEAELNLKVAKKVEFYLKQKRIPVVLTRRSNIYLSLRERVDFANQYSRNSLFVSIHFNAHRIRSCSGIETFFASARSKTLANNIQTRVTRSTRSKNRGLKNGTHLGVLHATYCKSALVECGFISNTAERIRCSSAWYQTLAAKAIAEGIAASR